MRKYSDEVKNFIAENVKGRRNKELVELVNAKFGTEFTNKSMQSYKKNHGLKNDMPTGGKRVFSEDIEKFVKNNHKGIGPTEMTNILNRKFNKDYTTKQIKNLYGKHGFNSGAIGGRFEKGIVPWNKGQKGIQMGGVETQFKKGQLPHNRREIGDERIDADGYTYVKIQDGAKNKNWKLKHNLIWEKHHGPIPKRHSVLFADGDKSNFDIENLLLVTRYQLLTMNRNGLIKDDAELTKTGLIIAKLQNTIAKKK